MSSENEDEEHIIKLVMLGALAVGKTALILKFVNNKFPLEHDGTIEDTYFVDINIEEKKRKLKIIDTAGHSDFQNNLDTWISQGDCFLLIYSINDINSFEQVNTIYKKICQIKEEEEENIIAILIGNKCDLPLIERKVLTNEAEEYAKNNNMNFLESSAFNGYNVKEAFCGITKKYLEINRDDSENKGGRSLCYYCF